jgi:hypothetical protein
VQLGRHGITVNCIHPGTTRTERTPSLLATRGAQLGISPEEAERRDFAPDSPRGNAICRMVDASEVAFVAVFLASEKAWAISGELVAASGGAGRAVYYYTEKAAQRRVLAQDQLGHGAWRRIDPLRLVPRCSGHSPPVQTLGVWSRALMVHYFLRHGGMHFGPSSSWQRHYDRGNPSSDTA